ncbi:HalOD1 output domain-containing protein [Natrialbaceae archaeon A-CW3]
MNPADDSTPPSPPGSATKRTYTESFDPATGPVEAIVDLVSRVDGQSPIELRPIYEVVDPDALDTLFSHRHGSAERSPGQTFEFVYEGYQITVIGDGRIELSLPSHPAKVTEPLE